MDDFYDDAYRFITIMEEKLEIRLSKEAKQMLILPLQEVRRIERRRNNYDFDSWTNSIENLMIGMKREPAKIDGGYHKRRSSLSVIKAFASKFCNIPPFCGER